MNAGDLCSRETARRRRCTHSAVALSSLQFRVSDKQWQPDIMFTDVQQEAKCAQSGQILVVQAFMLAL